MVNEVPAPTIENSLEGKVPGAIIESNNGGAPGGGLQIQVRGITSIYGNAEPLYVIDGVIVNNQTIDAGENAINRSGGGVSSTGQTNVAGAPSPEDNGVNRIADINPDDIENIRDPQGRLCVGHLRLQGIRGRDHHHHEARDDGSGRNGT